MGVIQQQTLTLVHRGEGENLGRERTPGRVGWGGGELCGGKRDKVVVVGLGEVLAPREAHWRAPATIPGSGGGTKAALMSERWGAPPHPPIP